MQLCINYFLPLLVVVVFVEGVGCGAGRTDGAVVGRVLSPVGNPLFPGRCPPEGVVDIAGRCGVDAPVPVGGLGCG